MKNIAYAEQDHSVFVHDLTNNNAVTITSDRMNYRPLLEAIKEGNEQSVRELMDESNVLKTVSDGRVTVRDNTVLLDGRELHSAEAKKLVDLVSEGANNIDRWFRFIEKLHDNPSYNCRQQAYNFIKHTGMPMTETGNLIGYKGVQDDYYSQHGNTNNTIIQGQTNSSGQILNTVGSTIEMERSNVDDNPEHGCSTGLHIGSHDYADSWAGNNGRLLTVEYSPTDIVSVPNECDQSKLRVCKYKVIAENTNRIKLNNGAYGMTSVDSNALFDWLDARVHNDVPVYFREVQHAFPNVGMSDIRDCIMDQSHYHADFGFDNHMNDFTIKFMELPS